MVRKGAPGGTPRDESERERRDDVDDRSRSDRWAPPSSDDGAHRLPAPTASERQPSETADRTAPEDGLFDRLIDGNTVFTDRELLRPSYTPSSLPQREEQVDAIAGAVAGALRGETPTNVLLYGKTGTGKTATARRVGEELDRAARSSGARCDVLYVNCEVIPSKCRLLGVLTSKLVERDRTAIETRIERLQRLRGRISSGEGPVDGDVDRPPSAIDDEIAELERERERLDVPPMTGLPTDEMYRLLIDAIERRERVTVCILDELDQLVSASDDILYTLSRMNTDLDASRMSMIGISNDLTFTEALDPRVRSSLGEREVIFPPYTASQLRRILAQRVQEAFRSGAVETGVVPLCAAIAAREHGDARRALDLLRLAGDLAERNDADAVTEGDVRRAHERLDLDAMADVVRTLPLHAQLVLGAIASLEKRHADEITLGMAYERYATLCEETGSRSLTHRRVSELVTELDELGLVEGPNVDTDRERPGGVSVAFDAGEATRLVSTALSNGDRTDDAATHPSE